MLHDDSGQVNDAKTDGPAVILCFPSMKCCMPEVLRQCSVALFKYGTGELLYE